MYKPIDRQSNRRLLDWYNFRQQLETSNTPLEDVARYFTSLPKTKYYTDPYDRTTWPTPWELITENEYCQFNIILGICYTLQLTTKYQNVSPMISICFDNINKIVYYMLLVEDKVYGYSENDWCNVSDLPKSLNTQKIYVLDPIH
jgi:hypothetical protein